MLDGWNEATPLFALQNCDFSIAIPFQLHEMFILFMTIFPPTQVPKSAVTNPDDLELWLKVITQIYGESIC
jgi:hypothetical protein